MGSSACSRDQRARLPWTSKLDDPLKVLRRTADIAPELVNKVEDAFMAYEIEAADSAEITPGVRELLAACAETDRPVVIVSNNSELAIERFLGALVSMEEWVPVLRVAQSATLPR